MILFVHTIIIRQIDQFEGTFKKFNRISIGLIINSLRLTFSIQSTEIESYRT